MNTTAAKIVDPTTIKIEWVVRYGDLTVDIVDPYAGLGDDAVLVSERGDCLRCLGTGSPQIPGASHYRGGKCFRCGGTGGTRETSTVGAEKTRIATHPAVMGKLMDEMGFILENRHRISEEQIAKFPVRA